MRIEELIKAACESAELPNTAKLLLPSALSKRTIGKIEMLSPEILGQILQEVVEQINTGSTESVDSLVGREIENCLNEK